MNEIETIIGKIANETALHGNTKQRVARALELINNNLKEVHKLVGVADTQTLKNTISAIQNSTQTIKNLVLNEIQIGGRNLLTNSKYVKKTDEGGGIAYVGQIVSMEQGQTYIVTAKKIKGRHDQEIYLNQRIDWHNGVSQVITLGVPFVATQNHKHLWVWCSDDGQAEFKDIKVEKGNISTDWTLSDKDITNFQIGGINLLRETKSFAFKDAPYHISSNWAGGGQVISETFNGNAIRRLNKEWEGFTANIPNIIGEPVIISFWAKTTGAGKFGNYALSNQDVNSIKDYVEYSNNQTLINDGKWHRYTIYNPKGMNFGKDISNGMIEFFEIQGEIFVSSLQVEIADLVSNWRTAIEDVPQITQEGEHIYTTINGVKKRIVTE